jgi:hypothetical protein
MQHILKGGLVTCDQSRPLAFVRYQDPHGDHTAQVSSLYVTWYVFA